MGPSHTQLLEESISSDSPLWTKKSRPSGMSQSGQNRVKRRGRGSFSHLSFQPNNRAMGEGHSSVSTRKFGSNSGEAPKFNKRPLDNLPHMEGSTGEHRTESWIASWLCHLLAMPPGEPVSITASEPSLTERESIYTLFYQDSGKTQN